MGRFLRENGHWIALPFLVLLGAMAVLVRMGTENDATAPFLYDVR